MNKKYIEEKLKGEISPFKPYLVITGGVSYKVFIDEKGSCNWKELYNPRKNAENHGANFAATIYF
jgi:hypothetical protein